MGLNTAGLLGMSSWRMMPLRAITGPMIHIAASIRRLVSSDQTYLSQAFARTRVVIFLLKNGNHAEYPPYFSEIGVERDDRVRTYL